MRVKPNRAKTLAHRTTVSMPEILWSDAEARMHARKHESFSEYVTWLIRRDLGFDDQPPGAHRYPTTTPTSLPRYPADPTAPASLNEA